MYFPLKSFILNRKESIRVREINDLFKEIVREWLDQVAERAKEYPEWVDVFERCYTDTLDNTVEILEDGSTFVLTGDIPAMWLRGLNGSIETLSSCGKKRPSFAPDHCWFGQTPDDLDPQGSLC